MPAMYSYTVVQEIEIKIRAESPSDAVALATTIFNGDPVNVYPNGHALTPVSINDIRATKEF